MKEKDLKMLKTLIKSAKILAKRRAIDPLAPLLRGPWQQIVTLLSKLLKTVLKRKRVLLIN